MAGTGRTSRLMRRKLAVGRRLIDRWRPGTEVYYWASGLKGEQRTARRLRRLRSHGWLTLHAVQWATGTDIDHLAIGPAGVFAVNSKRHPGKTLWYGDRAITVNGASTRHVAASQSEARKVSRTLSTPCGFEVLVRPVIFVVDAAKLTVKSANPPVLVLEVEHLDRVLSGLTPMLSADQVTHIYGVARQARTWSV
ncbi:nuclease-related domain-containing protein [Streptomyces griseoluteus]|uniref:nuclease-related domain-containing protein n=1 Tax=Streptomyces griseoluteus TaxID=29306 RepID=UPI0036889C1C